MKTAKRVWKKKKDIEEIEEKDKIIEESLKRVIYKIDIGSGDEKTIGYAPAERE